MNIGEPERETLRNILKNEAKLITSKFTLFTKAVKFTLLLFTLLNFTPYFVTNLTNYGKLVNKVE